VFDLFHIGHLNLLMNAKSMCDKLIVGVTTDELTEQIKGKMPIIPFNERSAIIGSIKFVDIVVSQGKIDEISDYAKYKFDIIFKGDDWKGTARWNELEVYFQKKGVRVIFIPYTKETSSSQLKKRIGRLFNE